MTAMCQHWQVTLLHATRETLETMAFAEVVSCDGHMQEAVFPPQAIAPDASGDAWGAAVGAAEEETAWSADACEDGLAIPAPVDPEVSFDQLLADAQPLIWARVGVSSAKVAAIYFIVSKSLAELLTHTMYAGYTDEVDAHLLQDTVAELVNTLGGRLLLAEENEVGPFRLTVPQTGEGMPEIAPTAVFSKAVFDGSHPVLTAVELVD